MTNTSKLPEITRQIVAALIFSADGKILMGRKDPAKGGVYADCWHIPGGGVDDGETQLDTLEREVFEETNLEINEAKIELIDDKGYGETEKTLKTGDKVWCKMNFFTYKVTLLTTANASKLQPSDDLVELKWFDVEDLPKINLTPPSIELFKRLNYS